MPHPPTMIFHKKFAFLSTFLPILPLAFATLRQSQPLRRTEESITNDDVSALLVRKDRFFSLPLLSKDYFKKTVPVYFTVTSDGSPDLPHWLHFQVMPNGTDAFICGTPRHENVTDTLHIVARNKLTYDIVQRKLNINVHRDSRSSAATQVVQLAITDFDLWQLVLHPHLMSELRSSLSHAFRRTRPFFDGMKPIDEATGSGVLVDVGTQKHGGFSREVSILAKGLARQPNECKRNQIVPLDRHFRPKFKVNWCNFRVSNLTVKRRTIPKSISSSEELRKVRISPALQNVNFAKDDAAVQTDEDGALQFARRRRSYFWDWVVVAAIPVAILLMLLLLLSIIFFGCREGQHWRDYKTPQKQLSEYVNLRRTQVNLRLLSFQRQSLNFLDDETIRAASTPVGKQTVADAAVNKGKTSSLNLYDNELSPSPAFDDGSNAPLTPLYDNQRRYVNTPTKYDNI